jgi:hypothetical protein
MRHDHVESVDGAPLENCDQLFRADTGQSGTRQERGRKPEAHQGARAILQEDSSGLH